MMPITVLGGAIALALLAGRAGKLSKPELPPMIEECAVASEVVRGNRIVGTLNVLTEPGDHEDAVIVRNQVTSRQR